MAECPLALRVSHVGMRFGGLVALNDVSFDVHRHSITALVGPNGAGKTTVFNCLTGFYQTSSGSITLYDGDNSTPIESLMGGYRSVTNTMALKSISAALLGGSHRINGAGIARTFQNIRLFTEMTLVENLLVAQHRSLDRSILGGLLRSGGYRRSERAAIANAYKWLDAVSLGDHANKLAGDLPYGHQRRLEIARAMCTNPKTICLDEPAAGLNPTETRNLGILIRELRGSHRVTVLLIEHNMDLVMNVSDQVVVLNYGSVIARGTPDAVRNDPAVVAAYLGQEDPAQ